MYTASRHYRKAQDGAEPAVVFTDDGGSGLLSACKKRFASPEFEVTCDAAHAVWVKRVDKSRSVGLPPWILQRQSLPETLDGTAQKLAALV